MLVDNSLLRAVARCSTEALWRYHLGYSTTEGMDAAHVGSVCHASLDTYFKQGGDTKQALGMLAHEYADLDPQPTDERLTLPNVRAVMQNWYESHPLEKLPFSLTDASFEQQFPANADDRAKLIIDNQYNIAFSGRLDGIVRNKIDGRWYILEHKTTGRITSFWTKQFQSSSQITGYLWAASLLKGVPIVGAFINAIEMSKLPGADNRKCKDHGVMYAECGIRHAKSELIITQRTSEQIAAWYADAQRLARRFAQLTRRFPTALEAMAAPQEGTFHGACAICQFSQFCQTGRRPQLVSQLLVKDNWEVINDKFQAELTA